MSEIDDRTSQRIEDALRWNVEFPRTRGSAPASSPDDAVPDGSGRRLVVLRFGFNMRETLFNTSGRPGYSLLSKARKKILFRLAGPLLSKQTEWNEAARDEILSLRSRVQDLSEQVLEVQRRVESYGTGGRPATRE